MLQTFPKKNIKLAKCRRAKGKIVDSNQLINQRHKRNFSIFGPFEAQCDSLIRTIESDSGDFQVSCPRVRRLLEEEPSYGVEVHPTDEVTFVLRAPLIPLTNPDETASNAESVILCNDQSSECDFTFENRSSRNMADSILQWTTSGNEQLCCLVSFYFSFCNGREDSLT